MVFFLILRFNPAFNMATIRQAINEAVERGTDLNIIFYGMLWKFTINMMLTEVGNHIIVSILFKELANKARANFYGIFHLFLAT